MSEMKDARVKPLEWRDSRNIAGGRRLSAYDLFGNEFARLDYNANDDVEAALARFKVSKQAAYERRVLDVLEPAPKPAGGEWVTVPRELTPKMRREFLERNSFSPAHYADASWAAMISATPPAPAASPSGGEVGRALHAIAEGYRVHGERDRYVVVENPEFKPDDGSNPCICIDVSALTSPEAPQASEGVRELMEALELAANSAGFQYMTYETRVKISAVLAAYKRSTTDGNA